MEKGRTHVDLRPIIILLIEDDADDAALIGRYLSASMRMSYEVVHADRLGKGLERLNSGGIGVVLLDLGLPDDAGGLSAFDRVHAQAPDAPVIVLTGNDDDGLAIEAMQKGAQDYLVKGRISGGLLVRSLRYAIERQKLIARLEHSLKEIKTLRGFLPICASCKKIRDDHGYWTRIETYISEHSEAEFSHGLCPECAHRLYGDILDKKT